MSTFNNEVQLVGNAGADVELMTTKSGISLVKFSLATNEYYNTSKGEKVKETQWHRIVAWGKTAELMAKIISKGDQILIKGKLTYSSYEYKEGVTKYMTEIKTREFNSFVKNEVASEEVPL